MKHADRFLGLPYRARDVLDLVRVAPGRDELRARLGRRVFRPLAAAGGLYRRRVLSGTRVVVVIGSLGKSTTARAVTLALGQTPHPRIEDNEFAFVVQALLRVRSGQRHAVIEVGIGARGQMWRYGRMLRPDVVVVTSIGSEHNRSLRTLDATRLEKSRMLRALGREGLGVFNADDPEVRPMLEASRCRRLTFGFSDGADVRARDLRLDWPRGSRFRVEAGGRAADVTTACFGETAARAALGAIAVALAEGVLLDVAAARLAALTPTPLRLQAVPLPGGAWLLRDEFKATIESVHAALDLLAQIPAPRRVVVMGALGEPPVSQAAAYRAVAVRIAQVATRVVLVGGVYGRFASVLRRSGMPRDAMVDAGTSLETAAAAAREGLGPGDVVLVKGRDTQRLDRVSMRLLGRAVHCDVTHCSYLRTRCEGCAVAVGGWRGARPVMAGKRSSG